MNKKDHNDKKKFIANEIVVLFKKLKISIILAIFFFIGYSVYNNLIQIAIFDYKFSWFEARDILHGYIPEQYVNIEDSAEYIQGTEIRTLASGHFEISEDGYKVVRKEIVSELFEDSFQISLLMIPIIFIILVLLYYILKSMKWVKKYSS